MCRLVVRSSITCYPSRTYFPLILPDRENRRCRVVRMTERMVESTLFYDRPQGGLNKIVLPTIAASPIDAATRHPISRFFNLDIACLVKKIKKNTTKTMLPREAFFLVFSLYFFQEVTLQQIDSVGQGYFLGRFTTLPSSYS